MQQEKIPLVKCIIKSESRKIIKKFGLAVLLFLFMHNAWAYDFESGGLYYNITSDTTVAVTYKDSNYYYDSYLGNITIPDTVWYNNKNYSVTSIGDDAFYLCYGLTSVTIPNSVTSIGNNAFFYCSGLTSIIIPNSVTSIGWGAFEGCIGLTSVTIPNSITSIGEFAFSLLPNLIYNGPAYNNGYNWGALCLNGYEEDSLIYTSSAKDTLCGAHKAITNANIPNSVTRIGDDAFYNCIGLTSVTIGNSVTSIGWGAFEGCIGLTSVTIPNSITSIGNYAFYYCTGLTSVTIPNSVTSIGNSAFADCRGLTSVTIPNSVTSIEGVAFRGCTGLTSVTIPNSVTSIGDYAFLFLPNLIYNGPAYNDGKNWGALCLNGYEEDSLIYTSFAKDTLCGAHKAIINANIPNSVTSIGDYAFFYCIGLTSVIIPNSVTSIGDYAFFGCDNIKYLDINTNVIGSQFQGISSLKTLIIGNSVTSIGDSVFYNCRGLTSVTIGDSVTSIGSSAFSNCIGLTSVTIPNSVTSIGNNAFYNCSGLTSITIPNSVTSIGYQAFYNCSGLISVTFLGSNTSVLDYAFYYVPDSMLIYVPCGSLSWYSSQAGLSGFSNMIEQFSYKYTVSSQDTTMGNVVSVTTPTTCANVTWTISATANYGYHFTQWSDGDTSNPRSIQVLSDTNIIAEFDTNAYQLTLSTDTTQGAVIGGGVYKYSSTAIISATANYGYYFTQWSDGDTTNPRSIQVLSDTNIIAEFDTNAYQLTLSTDTTQGAVIGGGVYKYLNTAIISATANYGYHFTQWSDGDTTNPRSIQVLSDTNITAEFDTNAYQLTLSTDTTQGTVIGGGVYKYLNTAIVSATANYGYHFTRWNDGDTTNPRSIQVLSDTILIAYFTPTFVQSADTNQGTIQVQQAPTQENKQITVLAVPKPGYLFSHWEDFVKGQKKIHKDGNNTENPRTFIWEEGMTLIAYFTKETTGIEEVSQVNNAVHLYPNPAKTMLNIENATKDVQIFDITGREIMHVENKGEALLQINVSHLSKGMYFVKVGNYTTKFVKE